MYRRMLISLIAVALVVTVGCLDDNDGIHPGWDEPVTPEGPYEMEDAVVYFDRGFEQLMVVRTGLDDDGPELDVERHDTGIEPGEPAISEDGETLFLVNRGDLPGYETLSIFEIDEDDVERQDVDLPSFYDEITVDPEGDFVLLSNSGEDLTPVQPEHELGIVDLRDGEPEFRRATLKTRARTPEFLPPFEMGGQEHRRAVVTGTNRVSIVDLEAETGDNEDRLVRLTTTEADTVEPTDLLFYPPSENRPDFASLFVLDDRSDDVTQIAIQPSIDESAKFPLDLSLNQLAAGQQPRAIEVVELDDVGQRLLALDGLSAEFSLVDVTSAESATFELPMNSPATGMKSYEVTTEEGETRTRVLVYSTNSNLVAVIRPEMIAVGGDTPTLGESIAEIRLGASPSEIVIDEESARAIVLHSGGDDGFSMIDLDRKRDVSWRGRNLSEVVFAGDAAYGIFGDSPHVARFDPVARTSRHFELPDQPRELFVGVSAETVLIQHPGDGGRFTAVGQEALETDRGGLFDDARLFEQVYLNDVLDRPVFEDDADE